MYALGYAGSGGRSPGAVVEIAWQMLDAASAMPMTPRPSEPRTKATVVQGTEATEAGGRGGVTLPIYIYISISISLPCR